MTNNPTEKRLFPRAKAHLKVAAVSTPKNRLELLDFSEGGMRFGSTDPISSPTISLQLSFSDTKLNLITNTKFVWEKPLKEGGSQYGVEFIDIKDKVKTALRTELIKTHVEGLLNDIKDRETRENISHFFLKDLADYIDKIVVFVSQVSEQGDHSRELQSDLEQLNTTILLKGYSLGLLLSDKSIMRRVKDDFRSLIGTWAHKSRIMKRAFEKRRAYPGDFQMLEMIYQNCSLSKGVGAYFDTYFLNNPDAVAVRSRKGRVREMLHRFILGNTQKTPLRILNVACGFCREMIELIGEMEHQNPLTLTCMDWDEEALAFSKAHLRNVPTNIKVEFLKKNLMDVVNDGQEVQQLGEYDLIYSIGLTDYLPDALLKKCLQFYNSLLPKGGQLILTHKNQEKTFPPIPAEWFCDWESIPRGKNELTSLLKGTLPGFVLDVTADDFGYIFYFTLTKK